MPPRRLIEPRIKDSLFSGRHGSTPYQRTLVAIRNKRTNRVKLVETSTVLLGAMVQPPPTTNAVLIKEDLKRREEAGKTLSLNFTWTD